MSMSAPTLNLARVGRGQKTHVLTQDGRVLCESKESRYRHQDGAGGYSNRSEGNWSKVVPTGTGEPTCASCRTLVQSGRS
jgi:hypothetical protein